ncbi:hypothetical protein RN22_03255 [Grimontia sp. AD028]|nr:hypothetical protein RN22_03255 [Grimontia sp. AD028]
MVWRKSCAINYVKIKLNLLTFIHVMEAKGGMIAVKKFKLNSVNILLVVFYIATLLYLSQFIG